MIRSGVAVSILCVVAVAALGMSVLGDDPPISLSYSIVESQLQVDAVNNGAQTVTFSVVATGGGQTLVSDPVTLGPAGSVTIILGSINDDSDPIFNLGLRL